MPASPKPEHAPDDTPQAEPDVDTSVADWRHEQLLRAGFTEPIALMLAELHHVDLHRACNLLSQGCDETTAWRILT